MTLADEAAWPRDRLDPDYRARDCVAPADFDRIVAAYAAGTAAARAALTPATMTYDEVSGEALDLYGAMPGERRPCVVFLHGGYWRALSRHDSGFMAPALASAGIACAVPDYTLAPAAGLAEIVRQARAAFAFLWRRAEALHLDRGRIVVTGSSAGGHLAAAVAAAGWQAAAELPDRAVAGALPISGLFELAPVAAAFPQDWLRLTPAEVAALSPLRHLPPAGTPVTVALAASETPGFVRQSAAYAAALGTRPVTVAGRNHFDVILDLADPASDLFGRLAALALAQPRRR